MGVLLKKKIRGRGEKEKKEVGVIGKKKNGILGVVGI